MYRYDSIDQQFVDERVDQFRGQMNRFLAGELSGDDFLPLRLQNGLYIQKHAPMLRVAVPYGMLASRQLRKLALGQLTSKANTPKVASDLLGGGEHVPIISFLEN